MDKQQIISFIQSQLKAGNISTEELVAIARDRGGTVETGPSPKPAMQERASWNVINTLYSIGTIIVLIGAVILTYQHWNEIGFAGRLAVTMGIALVTYIAGLLLGRSRMMPSQVMFTIASVLAPIGAYVLLNQFGIPFNSLDQTYAALSLLIVFIGAQSIVRNNILVIVLVGYGSWAYYAFLAQIFSSTPYGIDWIKWSSIVLGLAYILISYGYQRMTDKGRADADREYRSVTNVLYGLGSLAVLGAGLSLGGAWDFLYILFIFAAFYASVYVKSKSMLMFAAVFLVAYIIKLTSKYFINSIGWPVALIGCGFLIVVIGYATLQLNKRYFGQNPA